MKDNSRLQAIYDMPGKKYNKKNVTAVMCLITALLSFALVLNASAAMADNIGPECLLLDTNRKKRRVVNFPHRLHQKKYVKGGCKVCHHEKPDAYKIPCHNCHAFKRRHGVPQMRKAAHKMCNGCHNGKKASNHKSKIKGRDLTECDACHKLDRECMKP